MLQTIEGLQSVESLRSFSRVTQHSRGGTGFKGRSTLALHGVGVAQLKMRSESRVSRKAFGGGLAMGMRERMS